MKADEVRLYALRGGLKKQSVCYTHFHSNKVFRGDQIDQEQRKGHENAAIRRHRHDLCRVQRPCGKSGLKSAWGNFLLGEPADELDGRRGYSVQLGHNRSRNERRLRSLRKGRKAGEVREKLRKRAGKRVPLDEAPADSFAGVPGNTDVLLNGAHDVGIPAAALP